MTTHNQPQGVFNINDVVHVRLTVTGLKELLKHPGGECHFLHRFNRTTMVLSIQMWELMNIFGGLFRMGFDETMFDRNMIYIDGCNEDLFKVPVDTEDPLHG